MKYGNCSAQMKSVGKSLVLALPVAWAAVSSAAEPILPPQVEQALKPVLAGLTPAPTIEIQRTLADGCRLAC